MFIFHIYSSFETEGHCRDQGNLYQLKTIISFNSSKINMKNSSNYYHITMKNLSVPVGDPEMSPHSICKEKLEHIRWHTIANPHALAEI